jgi:hypothetical protein
MMVVRVPLPAIKGKAMGTTVEVASLLSDLKNSIPKTISNPKIKITIEPATAKERMSTPSMFRRGLPIKKKSTINPPEMSVTRKGWMLPNFFLMLISIGTEPTISITAKRVKLSVKNSLRLKFMYQAFLQK